MKVRQSDPIIYMLKLLHDLGVITHLNFDISPVLFNVLGSLDVVDHTNPTLDVKIYG